MDGRHPTDRAAAVLDRAWSGALGRWRNTDEPISLLFSGGVDSAVLAWELRRAPGLSLLTVGRAGSSDLAQARDVAARLGRPWRGHEISEDEVRRMRATVEDELAGVRRPMLSVFVAFALAVERTPPGTVLCGQGADELFLGYAHFRGLDAEAALLRSERDLARLQQEDWPRAVRLARRLGRDVEAPYLDPAFVAAARSVPIEARLPRPEAKAFLRAWARERGAPEFVVERPKRAFQYGSGLDRVVRRGSGRAV